MPEVEKVNTVVENNAAIANEGNNKLAATGAVDVIINNCSQEFAIMITLQENLNMRLGIERWKKYISSIFWYYISMPINFIITLFTAMSSGQVGTQTNYLSTGTLFAILFTAFILSTVNTFFKLKEVCESSYKTLQQFEAFSIEFENIYFQSINSNSDVLLRLQKYKKLQQDINTYCMGVDIDNISYLSECIYSCIRHICFNRFLKNKLKLINVGERFWVLDGKKKTLHYNKKYVNVNMDNFVMDIECLSEEYFDKDKQLPASLSSPSPSPSHLHSWSKTPTTVSNAKKSISNVTFSIMEAASPPSSSTSSSSTPSSSDYAFEEITRGLEMYHDSLA